MAHGIEIYKVDDKWMIGENSDLDKIISEDFNSIGSIKDPRHVTFMFFGELHFLHSTFNRASNQYQQG